MSARPSDERHPDQLPLGVSLGSRASFANFVPGANLEIVSILRQRMDDEAGTVTYLWGREGTGKTHLLEACCADATARARSVAYLPLAHGRLEPQMLAGLGGLRLVCVDDVDAVAGNRTWEEALFTLYNACEQASSSMVLCAGAAPRTPTWVLPDLASRLGAGVVYRLRGLADDERCQALQIRARERGFDIPDEVARFVLQRRRRDLASLFELLELLDHSSLAAKRRITVPFVKSLLDAAGK
jgi:DnaA family protein